MSFIIFSCRTEVHARSKGHARCRNLATSAFPGTW